MKTNLAIILFAFWFLTDINVKAQNTGSIQIALTNYIELPENIFRLSQKDSVIVMAYSKDEHTFSNLKPGKYNIEIFERYSLSRLVLVDNIEVYSDSITVCYFDLPEYYREELIDTVYDSEELTQVYLGLTYGISDKNNKGLIRDAFNLKMGILAMAWINKHLALGFNFGFYNFSHTRFLKDSSVYMPADHKRENYSYLYFPLGVMTRFSLNDMTKTPNKRIILDLGANYNLPFWFRHSFKENNQTTLTRKIQKYNDFTAYCALGITPFSVWAEYRLTDFLKDGFPEMPRLSIGIVFIIPAETSRN